MKIEQGEVICEHCNGIGKIPDLFENTEIKVPCATCHGIGKLDWVENIVGKKPTKKSALDSINVRRLLSYVEQSIHEALSDFMHEPIDDETLTKIEFSVIHIMNALKDKNMITAFNTSIIQYVPRPDEWTLSTFIQPTNTIETITLRTIIRNDC